MRASGSLTVRLLVLVTGALATCLVLTGLVLDNGAPLPQQQTRDRLLWAWGPHTPVADRPLRLRTTIRPVRSLLPCAPPPPACPASPCLLWTTLDVAGGKQMFVQKDPSRLQRPNPLLLLYPPPFRLAIFDSNANCYIADLEALSQRILIAFN